MPDNARDIAVKTLRDRDDNIAARLRRMAMHLSPADRAFATELALGLVRREPTLQAVLTAYLSQPGRTMKGTVRNIFLVALYQILFLDRVPDFAAVSEAVSQTKRLGYIKQSGLVNAVLRNVLRGLSPVIESPGPLSRNIIPLTPRTHRKANRTIFPDATTAPLDYLTIAMALPAPLGERWLERFKSLAKVLPLAYHANTRAPLIVRVNTLRTTVGECLNTLAGEGVKAVPHENGMSIVLDHPAAAMTELESFKVGLYQPQDPTATAVAAAAGVKGGMNVLDLCAAPGTKATHLAELMGNRGRVVAADVSREKLSLIESNCKRLGISIIETILSENVGSLEPHSFDVVLADVPCSNTGVLARRAEARYRFSHKALSKFIGDQKTLIAAAEVFVKRGGKLVYSTCSIEREEGGRVASWLCKQSNRLRLDHEKMTLPGGACEPAQWHDGGYLAIFGA